MQSASFLALTINIVRKDWREYQTPLVFIPLLMAAAVLANLWFTPGRPDFVKGLMGGAALGAGMAFAQLTFFNERQRGTLGLLLALPVTPARLVLAKYVSLYTMVLYGINVPGVLINDTRYLLLTNLIGMTLATLCMAATVVSAKSWAPQIPFFLAIVVALPLRFMAPRIPEAARTMAWVTENPAPVVVLAGLTLSVVAVGSAVWFQFWAEVE